MFTGGRLADRCAAMRRGRRVSIHFQRRVRLRQLHLSCFWIRILSEEEGGVPDGSHEDATAFIRNPQAERGALITIGAEEPKLHQFVSAEKFLQLREKLRGQPTSSDFQSGFERLTDTTQI